MRREYKEFSDEIYEIKQRIESEIVMMFKENCVERIELNRGFTMVWADYRLREVYVTELGCKVEGSNVDIAMELSNMITAQRMIQMNSRVFSTASSVMETLAYLGQ